MTYKEALKEAYKQPWKVDLCDSVKEERKPKCWCRVATLSTPIPYEEEGESFMLRNIISDGELGKSLVEYLVNLHNKSLEMSAKDGSSRPPCNHHPETCTCRDWEPPSPPKTDTKEKTSGTDAVVKRALKEAEAKVYVPPSLRNPYPTKTIASLTDEQLFHIAKLAYGESWVEGIKVTMEIDTKYQGKAKWRGVVITAVDDRDADFHGSFVEKETMRLWPNLDVDFIQDWDGGRGVSNQYQIYEYLRSLGIKPT